MKRAVQPDNYIQIDVKTITETTVTCNLYTGVSCIKMVIRKDDYDYLVKKGFFLRDGKEIDSAGVLNTTVSYYPE